MTKITFWIIIVFADVEKTAAATVILVALSIFVSLTIIMPILRLYCATAHDLLCTPLQQEPILPCTGRTLQLMTLWLYWVSNVCASACLCCKKPMREWPLSHGRCTFIHTWTAWLWLFWISRLSSLTILQDLPVPVNKYLPSFYPLFYSFL